MSTYDPRLLSPGAAPVVVVDLDSTICNTLGRRELAPTGAARKELSGWAPYSLACAGDKPIDGMIQLVRLLHGPNLIFLLSARNDVAEIATREWNLRHGLPYDRLRLRGDDEILPSQPSDWKIEVLHGWIREGWPISLFIDDWAETCLAVAETTGIPTVTPAFLVGDYKPGH